MTLKDFEPDYQNTQEPPPWDIGRPQPAVMTLAAEGYLTGNILDCGCGTGENTLYLASQGYHVLGIDSISTAIAQARQKAQQRDIPATFQQADAFDLAPLGQTFDTILDCGLMHNFPDPEIHRYLQSVARVIAPDGRFILLSFSDATIGGPGPLRRFSSAEIHGFFQDSWQLEALRPTVFDTLFQPPQVAAWLAILRHIPQS